MLGKREHWSSGLGFIFAAGGAAIGLGNIWKFPNVVGQNGGGAFVLVYLLCIVVIGIPVMLGEMTLGRAAKKNPVGAFKAFSSQNSHAANLIGVDLILAGIALFCMKQFGWSLILSLSGLLIIFFGWAIIGILCVAVPFLVLSYYGVVSGWTLAYVYKSFTLELNVETMNAAGRIYREFVQNPGWVIGSFITFMTLCALIVARGVKNGIERWSKILVPLLFALLLIVMLRSLTLPNAIGGIEFFLKPEFKRLSTRNVLAAIGHACFTLSLGMGIAITYSSYLSRQQNIFLSALGIAALDTLATVFAGLAVFPALFANNFAPDQGLDLIFNVLPAAFSCIPTGWLWLGLFFVSLALAALTSGAALLEVVVSYYIDEKKWNRSRAVLICTSAITLLGLLSALSIVSWENIEWVQYWLVSAFDVRSPAFLTTVDYLCSHWLLPLGILGTSIFVGWIWGTSKAVQEIRHGSNNFADVNLIALLAGLKNDSSHNDERYHVLTLASLWGIFIRFIVPVIIAIAFIWMNAR
ncbi:MAG: sodium-dependent transporter [Victivallaceae bacterium]|nr:sodium-dependent transporter [Victivallaceae bacterium]